MVTREQVKRHWEDETAGVRYGEGSDAADFYDNIKAARYDLEPFIPGFAEFERYAGKRVLEIGVGGGVDFSLFVANGARAVGMDLTSGGLNHTKRRLKAMRSARKRHDLAQADAENLPFRDNGFELVYSWGVLHHTPDTRRAFSEAFRVLKPGGELKVMVYHTRSWTGWMLWLRHGLMKGKLFTGTKQIVYEHLESPGTKVYTPSEARQMLREIGFSNIRAETRLGPGDLLEIRPSRRYQAKIYKLIWGLYPRRLIRLIGDRFGLYLLLRTEKPEADTTEMRS